MGACEREGCESCCVACVRERGEGPSVRMAAWLVVNGSTRGGGTFEVSGHYQEIWSMAVEMM